MGMGVMQQQRQHIVMLPFMAQGHLIPFLTLANHLVQRFPFFTITIATTPLNVRYLRTTLSSSHQILLSELPFNGSDCGLPPNAENTEALPLHLIVNLLHASTSLEPPFRALIRDITAADGAPPLCIISDVFMGWANDVAKSSATVNVAFTTCGAYGTAAYMSMWQQLPHRRAHADGNGSFTIPGFPPCRPFQVSHLHSYQREADGADAWSRFFQPQIASALNSFGWLCATAAEIEPLGVAVLTEFTKRPVWCIGPLLPPEMLHRKPSRVIGKHAGRDPGMSAEKCLEWLDSQPENSVVYISFGSQNTISQSQMMALALGLEDSGRPFIWMVRAPAGCKAEWLPEGFEERVAGKKQGLVVRSWAPQLEILCHRATGAFVSHCGWNSTVESLSQGVAVIGWPLAGEQGYNAKLLEEEMGVCVVLTRGADTAITREEVTAVIHAVMTQNKMRTKAAGIGDLIRAALTEDDGRKGSSLKAMDDFVATLLSLSLTDN